MRRLFFTLFFTAISLTGLAQGKVNVLNDSSSLVLLPNDTSLVLAADRALAGQPVGNNVPLPSGRTLAAGLYGGTSSSQLFLYSFTLLNVASEPAGTIPPFQVVLNAQLNGAPAIPGIASGTPIGAGTPWFQVKIWDAAYANFELSRAAGSYTLWAPEFQLNPGPSISYTFTAPPGVNSTWAETPFTWGPEPSTLALLGLGASVFLISRRRT